jgi:hypothetical protein
MKLLLNILVALVLTFFISCDRGNTIITSDGKNHLEINYSGKITFNEDETAIENMSPDGYLRFRNNDKELVAESNYHGEIKYELYNNGKRIDPGETDGKKFVADAINDMINIGFNAEERIERIYKKGGNTALLDAAAGVQGSNMKKMYLERIFSSGEVTDAEAVQVAKVVGAKMEGSYEKAQVLKKFSEDELKNPVIAAAWFEAAKTIDGNYEKADVLQQFSPVNITNADVATNWLAAVKTINANYEKEQVLKKFSGESLHDPIVSAAWLEAVKTINADFEKANALKIIVTEPLNNEQLEQTIAVTETIGANFEKSNTLKALIDHNVPAETASFAKLMDAIHNVSGDFERTDLLKKLVGKDLHSEEQWAGVIKETPGVNGEFERANLLVSIAGKMPKSDLLKTAYMNVAKTINSEMDYGKVVKALE